MGMLKSRADELERRLNQAREVLRSTERTLEHFVGDIRLLASDSEKIENENIQLKKEIQEQEKKYAEDMRKAAKNQS